MVAVVVIAGQLKAPPDDAALTAKHFLNLLRGGVGDCIKIFGRKAHQLITHPAADDIAIKSGVF